MKTKAYALMYSGAESPNRELTGEEIAGVNELVSQLTEKLPEAPQSHLGFTGFVALTDDEEKGTQWGVYGYFNGQASVWNNETQDWVSYYDTSGVCAYLFSLLNDTLQRHYREARTSLEVYMKNPVDAWETLDWAKPQE